MGKFSSTPPRFDKGCVQASLREYILPLPVESESKSLPPCLAVMHSAGAQGNEICCKDIHDRNTKFKESGGLQFQSN